MKKNTLRLIVSASVLVVLAGSYALLANQNRIQQAKEDAAESETGIDVSTAAADKISSFQLADGDTSFTLTKTDSGWTCVQDKHFPLSGDSADELVNAFVSFNAVRDLGTAQDGEDYGFSSASATVTLTSSDDTSCRLVLGNANSTTGDYYMKREDTNEVYTVSSSLADSFHKTLADLAVIETFPTVSSDNVQSLSVTENNSSLIFASSRTGSVKTWDISRSEDAGKTESTPEKATVNTVTTLIEMGIIPVVNENDTVSYDEIEIGDNDNLSAVVADLVDADLLVLFSDIDGLYDDDPHKNKNAKLLPTVYDIDEVRDVAGGAGTSRGTGGMVTKLEAAERATNAGIHMIIANGNNVDSLYDILDGKPVGTLFVSKNFDKEEE